jgi:glucose-6-phosphate dehydrogenase assembly protein OpcA
VAQAVSAKVPPVAALDWHGDAVTIEDVLNALTDIRRKLAMAALTTAADQEHPHPRSYVMTLVAVAATEAEERRAQAVGEAIAANHPSLAIIVRDEPNVQSGRIDAAITTELHKTEEAGPIVFELVTLHVRGAAGEHLAALVDPLLVSGVPTYMWWLGTPPFRTSELTEALRVCDALVFDSAHFESPYNSFLGLAELAASAHRSLRLADFQWARLSPWRETIAQFFAPVDRRGFMESIGEVGIDYVGEGRGNRIGAALLVGWLSSAMGWKLQKAFAGAGGVVVARFMKDEWRLIEVHFRSVPKAHQIEGEVSAIRIAGASGEKSYRLTILRDPDRPRQADPDIGPAQFKHLHNPGGDDDAGFELAERSAAKHREVLEQNREALHHTNTGDPPEESLPPHPTVYVRERRRLDTSTVLLTLIDIGDAPTLRHVQRLEPDDDVRLLVQLLSVGSRDPVYARSLFAGADLMRAL